MIKSSNKDNYFDFSVGLDIGTSKVCMMISQKDSASENYNLLGFGITESDGLSRGVVNNIDRVTSAIEKVLTQVQNQSGYAIKDVVVGIAGDHIQTICQKGLITVSKGDSEISREDVSRLIDEAKKIAISADKKIIHTIPLNYTVDSNFNTIDPIGMAGVRLEADIMLVTALNSAINNVTKCVERAGLNLKELVLEPIASSYATLTDEEKEVGVALVDIGGGTTDIAIYTDRILHYTSVIAVGGKLITSDIRKVLGITETNAENIKKEFGTCNPIEQDSIINVPLGGGNKPKEIMRSELNSIIRERCIEMFQYVKYELIQSKKYNDLGAGIILTGGCALLDGICELAEEVLELPVKIGIPRGFSMTALAPDISSPVFSTAVGLSLFGHHTLEDEKQQIINIQHHSLQNEKTQNIEHNNTNQISDDEANNDLNIKKEEKEPSSKNSLLSKLKKAIENI
ncbi:MAG TPA: cell division protein FtsA [Candidatus Kapabacteria bacterium]|nr:cell division protein FtsA [Candidatus Kapabacteria bacterium]